MKKAPTTRSLFTVNAAEKTISASKSALTRAANPYSKEYKELNKLLAQHPRFSVVEKHSRKKNTYDGMDFPFMQAYIRTQKDGELLLAEFETVKLLNNNKYGPVKKWFFDTFKDEDGKFDMRKAKREIVDARIQTAKVMVRKVNKSTMTQPKAVNE